MGEEGSKTKIADQEYSFTVKKFALGKSFLTDDIDPENIARTDFSKLSDEDMWVVINWVVVKGRSKDLFGVGATQTTDPKCECEEDVRD